MSEHSFKFDLEQEVTVTDKRVDGTVAGFAKYNSARPPQYLLKHFDVDGCETASWFCETELKVNENV